MKFYDRETEMEMLVLNERQAFPCSAGDCIALSRKEGSSSIR